MDRTKHWYVVYTRTGQEQKVCDCLRRKKIESFYPVNKLVKTSYGGRERISFKPLLERFVFVCTTSEHIDGIKKIEGVANFVHWLYEPVLIDQNDILIMKRFCNMHNDIHIEKTKVASSECAYVSTSISNHGTELANLHFPVLGYNMIAEENRTRVKIITTDYQTKTEISNNQYAEAR